MFQRNLGAAKQDKRLLEDGALLCPSKQQSHVGVVIASALCIGRKCREDSASFLYGHSASWFPGIRKSKTILEAASVFPAVPCCSVCRTAMLCMAK